MPQVIIEQPGMPPMTYPLGKEITAFGRSEESDVQLVADEVSRHHAKIIHRNGMLVLKDLDSLNGTYVNRQRIVERVLSHMDEIWFGSKCRLIYRDDTQHGRAENAAANPHVDDDKDSQVLRKMDMIRAEMEQLGNTMTLIGRKTPAHAPAEPQASQGASGDDMVKMARAYRRLAVLHEAGKSILSSDFDLRTRLSNMLDKVIELLDGDRGFIMLRDLASNTLTVSVAREMGRELEASSPSMGIAGRAAIDGQPVLMARREEDEEFGMRDSIIRHQIASAMCVPLRVGDRILGSMYIDTRKAYVEFSDEDLELFMSLAAQSAMAIDNIRLHDEVVEAEKKRQNFGRFLSPAIVEKIMNDKTGLALGGQKTHATALFCDIRGSSKLAEQLSPQELVELLNEHFTAMTEIIFQRQGTLDKYIGDEIMAVFGAPISTGDDEFNAVCAAIEIQMKNRELNLQREREGRPLIHLGIGIESGDVIAGYVGSPRRMEFTVVGDRVNTAKRFCDMAGADMVVIGDETFQAVADRVTARQLGTVMLKGKERAAHAHEITGLKASC